MEIQTILEIGSTAANTIVTDQLQVMKHCGRWVLHSLTEEQKVASSMVHFHARKIKEKGKQGHLQYQYW